MILLSSRDIVNCDVCRIWEICIVRRKGVMIWNGATDGQHLGIDGKRFAFVVSIFIQFYLFCSNVH